MARKGLRKLGLGARSGRRARSVREMACISVPCGVRPVPPFPGALVNFPDGQTAPKTPLSPATRHDPARHSAAPLPAGQTASTPHTGSAPCPKGKAASPNAPQAAGPCSWACHRQRPPPPHPKRNAAHPPPARGAWAREHRANGSGWRHRRPRGPAAVNALPCPIRPETQYTRPLLVGRVCFESEPMALAGGTAALGVEPVVGVGVGVGKAVVDGVLAGIRIPRYGEGEGLRAIIEHVIADGSQAVR